MYLTTLVTEPWVVHTVSAVMACHMPGQWHIDVAK